MKRLTLILCFIAFFISTSCERRPFIENRTEINLSLKINMKIQSSIVMPDGGVDVEEPELVRVCLCDRKTGEVVYQEFVGPKGGYIYPEPGVYDILVYNINTESTIIRNENNLNTAEAFTGEISKFQKAQIEKFLTARRLAKEQALKEKGQKEAAAKNEDTKTDTTKTGDETKVPLERIVNEPDHVFVGRQDNIVIPQLQAGESRNLVIEIDARTIVEVWNIKMTNIEGCEYISNVNALMTGMAESTMMYTGEDTDRPVTIFFGMQVGKDKKSLIASFRTFGKNPFYQNNLELDLNVTDTGGNEHIHHFDVTDQFDGNDEHLIIVDKPIKVEPPKSGGGFAPEVDDWEDVETDIII